MADGAAGSRFLSNAEKRYAMIELECLAATWAMIKTQKFVEGLTIFTLITDHKPLVPILNDQALDKLDNPRILRLRLKMQRFSFIAKWVPGKANVDADALSRAPVSQPKEEDELAEGPASSIARQAIIAVIAGSSDTVIDPVLERIKEEAASDNIMVELRDTILKGFPNGRCNLSAQLRPFWAMRESLAIDEQDDMILAGSHIVVPLACRKQILKDLIQMHQGATKLRQRARSTLYWPGMDKEITWECVGKQPNRARYAQKCRRPIRRNLSIQTRKPRDLSNKFMRILLQFAAEISWSWSTSSAVGHTSRPSQTRPHQHASLSMQCDCSSSMEREFQ